jgi:hypothetical protein
MPELMPFPRCNSDFLEWLVPARNNIQHELFRIKELLAESPPSTDAVQRSLDEDQLNLELGAAYSLWKAGFQDGHQVDDGTVMNTARDFVDEVVRSNAAINNAETSAWSLGYYLRGARLRLIQAGSPCIIAVTYCRWSNKYGIIKVLMPSWFCSVPR